MRLDRSRWARVILVVAVFAIIALSALFGAWGALIDHERTIDGR
jgi:hypothetical protein